MECQLHQPVRHGDTANRFVGVEDFGQRFVDRTLHLNTWRALAEELREDERGRTHEIRIDARAKIIATLDSSQVEVYRGMIAHDDSARAERANRRRR